MTISNTKTPNAKRTVSFGPALTQVLQDAKRSQAAWRLALGAGWRDHGLVVDNGNGDPVHPERISQYFERLATRLDLGVTLHSLRHFAISTWLRAGVPVLVVSRMAGHAKSSFTMDTYGHYIPEDQDAPVEAMDRALAAKG